MFLVRPLGTGAAPGRRPMLLALVFGVFLVLVGITAGALVFVATTHTANTTLASIVRRDTDLVRVIVSSAFDDRSLEAGMDEAVGILAGLPEEESIVRVEIRGPDGTVLGADRPELVGERAPDSDAFRAALAGEPRAALVDRADLVDPSGPPLEVERAIQVLLPLQDADGATVAVVALWRDAAPVLAALDATGRDILLVTVAAALLLAAVLFLVFRAAQVRLSRQQAQLVEPERRDPLTDLLNHGAVVAGLAEALERARGSGRGIGVALLDVDNFRLLNDTHGHDAGDEVLLHVAEVVDGLADGEGVLVGRYGPDEFLLVHEGADLAAVEGLVTALRTGITGITVQFGESERLPVSVSVGIAIFPDHADAVTELLSAVAVAVGEAKASGGDAVRVAHAVDEDRAATGSFDVLQGLVIAVDTKDRYTKRHSEDVARYAVFLAQRLGLDEEFVRTLHLAGLLHDVGKIGVPDTLLRKPSKLTAQEFAVFQQHVALGDAIVRDLPNLDLVRDGIRNHHERWDGKGYLAGLEGETIPLIGRILAVADTFSAMTTTRPYRKALPLTEALKRLGDAAGTQLEEDLVTAFIAGIETDADAPLPGEEPGAIWRPELWVA